MAMAHGYAKAAGKPMLVVRARRRRPAALVDGAVPGLGRPRADRASSSAITAIPSGVINRPHSAQDMGVARPRLREVRRRGDDARAVRGVGDAGVPHRDDAAEGAGRARGRRGAAGVAASRIGRARAFPELSMASPPQGDANAVREAARLLVNAETPLIQISEDGTHAERLGPVGGAGRTATGAGRRARLCLVAVVSVVASAVRVGRRGLHAGRDARPRSRRHVGASRATARANGRKTISISSEHLFQHSNIHDFGRYADVDLAIAADAETTLPSLIEEVRRLMTPERKSRDRRRAAPASRRRTRRRTLKAVEDAPPRMGRQPGQRPAADRGARRPNQERRLGDRLGPPVHRRLAAAAAELRQALSLQRRQRRVRHRLRLAGIGRRARSRTRSSAACRSASSATAT